LQLAFTMDDLPLWPQADPPAGHTASGIVAAICRALSDNGITGVYAFSNSWPLDRDPALSRILDDWLADGHHLANHTHGHIQLPDVTAAAFIADIDRAADRLAPWLAEAPLSLFRHPLCHWGETDAKRATVNDHLHRRGLTPVDVTSWAYEWVWNRAWLAAREAGDRAAERFVFDSFLEFVVAQHRHDSAAAQDWFGESRPSIALGHNVAFFAEIAHDYFATLTCAGVAFVPLAAAIGGAQQAAVGSVTSGSFLVLQQKLAEAAGTPLPRIAPEVAHLHARIAEMAGDRRD
jgi:hypothetical protein